MIVALTLLAAFALLIFGAPWWLGLACVIAAAILDIRRTDPQRRR